MRRRIPAFALLAVLALPAVTLAGATPSSPRSAEAVEERAPTLEARLAARDLQLGAPVLLRIFKEQSVLEAWVRGGDGRYRLFDRYPICAWSGELGPKRAEGDRQAPEGFYRIEPASLNPRSRFHLSFNLGYPNAYDRAHGRTGSFLMVHGGCVSIGCYAMTDPAIEELWTLVRAALRAGQEAVHVHALPFPLTRERLRARDGSRWHAFWRQLAAGYRAFERTRVPPRITVRDGRTEARTLRRLPSVGGGAAASGPLRYVVRARAPGPR